jgi:tetratricopeptide (TPR) repeat protein
LSARVERVDALSRLKTLSLADVADELQDVRGQARTAELWQVAAQALDVEVRSRVREEDVEGIRRCLKEAETYAKEGPPRAQCLWLNILANHQNYGDPEKAKKSLLKARVLAHQHDLRHEHTLTLHRLIAVLLQQGTAGTPEGLEILSQGLGAAKRSGDLDLKFRILANLGAWYIDIGEYEAARQSLEEAEVQVEGMEAPGPRIIINVNMGELEFWAGDFDAAFKRFRNAEALLEDTGRSRAFWMVRPGLGLSALMVGDLKEARRQDDLVKGVPLAISFDPTLLTLFRARLLQTRGHVAEAVELIEESAEEVRIRMQAVSLKLLIESMRLRIRNDRKGAERVGLQARHLAEELVLPRRTKEIDRILTV